VAIIAGMVVNPLEGQPFDSASRDLAVIIQQCTGRSNGLWQIP
jgi:hypothetical protein